MLVDDIVKEFIFELQVQNYTPRTIKGYKNNILKFMEYCKQEFEVFELEEIKNDISEYKIVEYKKGYNVVKYDWCFKDDIDYIEGLCKDTKRELIWLTR